MMRLDYPRVIAEVAFSLHPHDLQRRRRINVPGGSCANTGNLLDILAKERVTGARERGK